MNSLIFLACVAGGMTAGFLLGAFSMRDLARIDANYWKSMCELNTNHWKRMYELERGHRETTDVTPDSPDESVSDEQEGESVMSGQGPFYQLWAEFEKLREINAKLASVCKAARKRLSEVGLSADRCEQPIEDIETLVRQIDDALAEHCDITSPSSVETPS